VDVGVHQVNSIAQVEIMLMQHLELVFRELFHISVPIVSITIEYNKLRFPKIGLSHFDPSHE
jgi:hypothetical protein